MDQLAHVLVITHNTSPSVRLRCPTVLGHDADLTFDVSARLMEDLSVEQESRAAEEEERERERERGTLLQFACSFALSVSMLANLRI